MQFKSTPVPGSSCHRDYAFRMNVTEEIFETRSCIEILANDIEVDTVNRELQGNVYTIHIGDLHPLGGKNVLNMYDLFDYSVRA